MDWNLGISIAAMVLTIIGTGVTLYQARKVKSITDQITKAVRVVRLSQILEALKEAQNEARTLITPKKLSKRGQDELIVVNKIQQHFDVALSYLSLKGDDSDIRKLIDNAQTSLRKHQAGSTSASSKSPLVSMYKCIQTAISHARTRILTLENL